MLVVMVEGEKYVEQGVYVFEEVFGDVQFVLMVSGVEVVFVVEVCVVFEMEGIFMCVVSFFFWEFFEQQSEEM